MKSEALRYFTDTQLTVAGLLIFIGIFVMCVGFVLRKDKQDYFNKMQDVPLQD